jgi:hypothetical protein
MQIALNLARHISANTFPHGEMNIVGNENMKDVMPVSVLGEGLDKAYANT